MIEELLIYLPLFDKIFCKTLYKRKVLIDKLDYISFPLTLIFHYFANEPAPISFSICCIVNQRDKTNQNRDKLDFSSETDKDVLKSCIVIYIFKHNIHNVKRKH